MSKKSERRSARNQKRKLMRKTKRKLKKIERAGKACENVPSDGINVVAVEQQQTRHLIDQRPTTSRHSKTQLSLKRSPRNNTGGKVKTVDDQAIRSYRRTVYIAKNYKVQRKFIPIHVSPQKKNTNRQKRKNKALNSVNSTLEEGEICSDTDRSFVSTTTEIPKTNEDEEDDCIVIEPTLEAITIDDVDDDDADDDIPSTSDISTNYEFIMSSLKQQGSSTPCHKGNAMVVNTSTNGDITKTDDNLPFFVDVRASCGTESINSTDNFSEYTKLSTLKEKSTPKHRCTRLKQTDDTDEVIELDDTSTDNTDTTLKCKSGDFCDDSVIFISETNKHDFIPIVDVNLPAHKILKISDSTPRTPDNRLGTNNLFTQSETKKLNEYNENAYNPTTQEVLTTGKRMVILDGSNVAFKHGLDQKFSVKGLKIAIEYFEKIGHEVKAVIPQFRMNRSKSTNPEELEKLHKAGKIVQTPCKNLPGYMSSSYDDRFILQLAFALDAAIVSNDNYRDLLHESPAFKKIVENRVIGYTWCNDIFILPKDPYGKWGPTLHTILNR